MKDWFALLKAYLREKALRLALAAVCCGIFGLVFFLYQLPVEAVAYAVGVCALPVAVAAAVDFIRYRERHRMRAAALSSLCDEHLPEPDTLAEEELTGLARAFSRLQKETATRAHSEQTSFLEYYTTWVHQIKTPIAAMQMMLQEEDTEEHRALLAELFSIEQYVDMALNYVRLGDGASDFVFRTCSLDEVLRRAIRKFAPQFVRKRIRLHYEPVDCRVATDEKWLGFLVEQLLSNAVKYTNRGSVTITVAPGPVLRIADTGISIQPEDLPRIFEKGFTGYNGRTHQKSTGLGLYLAKRTAEKLNVSLSAASVAGEGSVFSVDLRKRRMEID